MKFKQIKKYIQEVLDFPHKSRKVMDYTEVKVLDCGEEFFLVDKEDNVICVITEIDTMFKCITPKQYAKYLNEIADFRDAEPFKEVRK